MQGGRPNRNGEVCGHLIHYDMYNIPFIQTAFFFFGSMSNVCCSTQIIVEVFDMHFPWISVPFIHRKALFGVAEFFSAGGYFWY